MHFSINLKVLVNGHVVPVFREDIPKEAEEAERRKWREDGSENEDRVVDHDVMQHMKGPLAVDPVHQFHLRVEADCVFFQDVGADYPHHHAEDPVE